MSRELLDLVDLGWLQSGESLATRLSDLLRNVALKFGASGVTLFIEQGDGEFELAAQFGVDRGGKPGRIRLGVGIAGIAIGQQKPLLVNDPREHPELRGRVRKRGDIVSSLIVPLGKLGVMNLSRTSEFGPFSEEDLMQAQEFAAWLTVAIANDRMAAQLRDAKVQLQESERLKRLAEIGQMTAAIAHEIRNPLTGILASAQMLRQDPTVAAAVAEIIEDETLKLNRLCDEFLDFSKPIQLKPAIVDPAQVARTVGDRMRYQFAQAGVKLAIELDWDPRSVFADPLRLEQVLQNLIQNALEHTQPGGVVIVRLKRNQFEVADNGRGIPDDVREKLFQPFFTTRAQGTGLGLSNVKKVLDAQGWRIEVRSREGMGTTVRVHMTPSKKAA